MVNSTNYVTQLTSCSYTLFFTTMIQVSICLWGMQLQISKRHPITGRQFPAAFIPQRHHTDVLSLTCRKARQEHLNLLVHWLVLVSHTACSRCLMLWISRRIRKDIPIVVEKSLFSYWAPRFAFETPNFFALGKYRHLLVVAINSSNFPFQAPLIANDDFGVETQ